MVSDALLNSDGRKEALSKAYVHAVAAGAGYTTAVYDYDRNKSDILVQAGGYLSPAIGLQLKATTNLRRLRGSRQGLLSFQVRRRDL